MLTFSESILSQTGEPFGGTPRPLNENVKAYYHTRKRMEEVKSSFYKKS